MILATLYPQGRQAGTPSNGRQLPYTQLDYSSSLQHQEPAPLLYYSNIQQQVWPQYKLHMMFYTNRVWAVPTTTFTIITTATAPRNCHTWLYCRQQHIHKKYRTTSNGAKTLRACVCWYNSRVEPQSHTHTQPTSSVSFTRRICSLRSARSLNVDCDVIEYTSTNPCPFFI